MNVILTTISFKEILEYYAIFNLICYPFFLYATIKIYKSPGVAGSIDRMLDRILFKKGKDNEKDESIGQNEEKMENTSKCPVLFIRPSDSFQCVLNPVQLSNMGGTIRWNSSNPFVGNINESTGIFHAERIGTTIIDCSGKSLYEIHVIEMESEDWFASSDYKELVKERKDNLNLPESQEIGTTITNRRLLRPSGTKVLEHDSSGNLLRFIYIMKPNKKTLEIIMKRMSNRMKLISEKESDSLNWIHINENKQVDYIAFLMKSINENILFGVGVSWIDKGTEENFINNPQMTLFSFRSLLDSQDIPKRIETKPMQSIQRTEKKEIQDTMETTTEDKIMQPEPSRTISSEKKEADSEPSDSTPEEYETPEDIDMSDIPDNDEIEPDDDIDIDDSDMENAYDND